MREKGGEKASRERRRVREADIEGREKRRRRRRWCRSIDERGKEMCARANERRECTVEKKALEVDNPGSPSEYLCSLTGLAAGKFIIRFS